MSYIGGIRTQPFDGNGTRPQLDAGRGRAEFTRSVAVGDPDNGPVPPVEQVVEGEVLGRRYDQGSSGNGGYVGPGSARVAGRQYLSEVALRNYAVSAYQSTEALASGRMGHSSGPMIDYYA